MRGFLRSAPTAVITILICAAVLGAQTFARQQALHLNDKSGRAMRQSRFLGAHRSQVTGRWGAPLGHGRNMPPNRV